MSYNKEIVNYIWRGFGSIDIVKDLAPGTDREERELFERISQTRAAIQKLVKDVPGLIELGLRNGFSETEVFNTIDEQGEHLIPRWNLECLIAGVQGKLDKENQAAREAAEKVEADAKRAAIDKQIADARQALLDSGLPC